LIQSRNTSSCRLLNLQWIRQLDQLSNVKLAFFAPIISGRQATGSNVMLLLALRQFQPAAKTAGTDAQKGRTKNLPAF
jgi:hypothetical protein